MWHGAPVAHGSGGVRPDERVLAPDLARGLALLGIALANCVVYVFGRETGPLLRPVDGTSADRVVDALVGTFVDNRAFPMFTMLFAYGFVMILRRQAAAGSSWTQARGVLLRRSGWLVAIGAAHLLLLFFGDIVMTYGLLGLALVLVIRWSDRALWLTGAATLLVFAGLSALDGLSGAGDSLAATGLDALVQPGSFAADALLRLVVLVSTLLSAPLYVAALLPPAVVGILLARHGVLEDPAAHLPLLRRMAVGGLALSVLGALPLVLMATQVVQAPQAVAVAAAALHGATGLAGALGFLGLVGWFAARRPTGPASRRGPVGALTAVGSRSLTCYLLQSVLFVPLLAPWALGLGVGAGTATVSAIAVGVWLATVLVAVALERAGRPGPAEALLRRLVYGARSRPVPGVDPTITRTEQSGPA